MTEQVKPPVNPRLAKMDLCKSGRPKAVVSLELFQERKKLDQMHVEVDREREKRAESDSMLDVWVTEWKARHPGKPVNMEYYPYKRYEPNTELIKEHQRQHYVIAELEDELEGRGEA